MTSSKDDDPYRDDDPLRVPLEDLQLDALGAIWEPARYPMGTWPVWDYVARTLYRLPLSPPVTQPQAVLGSLPRVAPLESFYSPAYGLWWHEGNGPMPSPNVRVGLSIAGLDALRAQYPDAGDYADYLAVFIGRFAEIERNLAPDPNKAVTTNVAIALLLMGRDGHPGGPELESGARKMIAVLQREFAPVDVTRLDPVATSTVKLSMFLAPYCGVKSAQDYLDRVEVVRPRALADPALVAGQLPEMLDYLSYVLMNDPEWRGSPLVALPDLVSAARLVDTVHDAASFRDRMSALAIILDRMNVPDVPAAALSAFEGKQPRSLVKLEYWLKERLDERDQAVSAVKMLRAAVRVRVAGQHTGKGIDKDVAKAKARLGLPELILDWSDAWDIVRARVTESARTISQEVRLAPV